MIFANDWFWLVVVFLFGANVGSFLNVVIYRLPAGLSVVSPPSHDPETGQKLAWWENIPILSWCWLRGKSRYSGKPISVQYPLIELITALLFALTYAGWYMLGWRQGLDGLGPTATWPVLLVTLLLIAGLLSSSVVDGKLYIIPLEIPWTCTVIALVGLPIGAWLSAPAEQVFACAWQPILPVAGPLQVGAAVGGAVGLGLGCVLLWTRKLPRGFEVPEELAEQTRTNAQAKPTKLNEVAPLGDESETPEQWLAYPHPRREMVKEFLFLGWPVLGVLLGVLLAHYTGITEGLAWPIRVLAGCVWGYLIGGGIVWGIRMLGTLMFGKEAMGLGDVHLLAAVGAVVGAVDIVIVFFLAPFIGIAGALATAGATAILKRKTQAVPYGPSLALASLLMLWLGRSGLDFFGIFCR